MLVSVGAEVLPSRQASSPKAVRKDGDNMMANRSYESEQKAYEALLSAFWEDAPGELTGARRSSEEVLKKYENEPEKISNASIALGFLADNELLLAGNLIACNRAAEGWEWMDKSLAHAHFMYRVADLSVWRPSRYSEMIFNFEYLCSRFAVVLARGTEDEIQWYAQQVYNLVQGGLADTCCAATEYVDLYFDIAVSVLRNEWRHEEALADRMDIYRDLFRSVGDEERVRQAVLACARYHLDLAAYTAPKNDDEESHPFRLRCISHIAYELMAWHALYKRFYGALNIKIEHPMWPSAFVDPPKRQPYSDPALAHFNAQAEGVFGQSWVDGTAIDIDKMD
jgi:hypothetical protein